MLRKAFLRAVTVASLIGSLTTSVFATEKTIILQSTTSTANSGLYDNILPIFTEKTGTKVHVVAVGTGQAIKNAMNGDGDVLLVHAKSAEQIFVADGFGIERFDVMYNDFIIVGPPADPAKIRDMENASAALAKISITKSVFTSRGDNSGTHKKESHLWSIAGVDPTTESGTWYRETGSGMGAALNTAIGMNAYALTDRGTWISFRNKGAHQVLVEGDHQLSNQYGIILINPQKHPTTHAKAGQTFIDWMLSDQGQNAIANYKPAGQQLFFPNAEN